MMIDWGSLSKLFGIDLIRAHRFISIEKIKNSPLSFVLEVMWFLFALFATYIVLGGIFDGEITIFEDTPLLAVSLLVLAIILIASLEGLQMAVAKLQLKDLEELQEEYPRAYNFHQSFKMNDEIVEKFLSGRQIVIVASVFIAARLTTFPNMDSLPFLSIPFPRVISPWFQLFFLEFGLLGSLVVYWYGNLMSQLYATKYPLSIINFPVMSSLFGFCVTIYNIRLPYVSELGKNLLSRGKDDIEIPYSSVQKYERELKFDRGYGISYIGQKWTFEEDRIRIDYEINIKIGRENVFEILIDQFNIPSNLDSDLNELEYAAVVSGQEDERTLTYEELGTEDVHSGRMMMRKYVFLIDDPQGMFHPGDEIVFEMTGIIDIPPITFQKDQVAITHPTKQAAFFIDCDFEEDSGISIDPPILRVYDPIHAEGAEGPRIYDREKPIQIDNESYTGSEIIDYPRDGSLYEFEFNFDYI